MSTQPNEPTMNQTPSASPPLADETRAVEPGLVTQIQQRQAEVTRLLTLCQHLRRTGACPGRCVRSATREQVLREFQALDVFQNSTVQEEPGDWR
jgi:hypothetical protein